MCAYVTCVYLYLYNIYIHYPWFLFLFINKVDLVSIGLVIYFQNTKLKEKNKIDFSSPGLFHYSRQHFVLIPPNLFLILLPLIELSSKSCDGLHAVRMLHYYQKHKVAMFSFSTLIWSYLQQIKVLNVAF